jgi:hypothetical protein
MRDASIPCSIPCSVPCSVPDSPFQQEQPFLAEKPLSSYLDRVCAGRNSRLILQSIFNHGIYLARVVVEMVVVLAKQNPVKPREPDT